MPVSVRLKPLSVSYQILVDQVLSPKARNDKVALVVRRIIARADDQNRQALGYVPPKTVKVNGRDDDTLTHLIPPDQGVVVAEYELVGDVLKWIMQTLRDRSPTVGTGAYRDGHRLFADDVEVDDPNKPPMVSRYAIFNLVPYARRLEVGKTKTGRDFLISVPNRIYARTHKDAQAKFGNVAKITTGFTSATGQYAYHLKFDQPTRSFKGGVMRIHARQRPDRVEGSIVTVPVIYVTIG